MREAFHPATWLFGKSAFFQRTRLPLMVCFPAICLVSRAKAGLRTDRFFDKIPGVMC
jgi:hypothetical protein